MLVESSQRHDRERAARLLWRMGDHRALRIRRELAVDGVASPVGGVGVRDGNGDGNGYGYGYGYGNGDGDGNGYGDGYGYGNGYGYGEDLS